MARVLVAERLKSTLQTAEATKYPSMNKGGWCCRDHSSLRGSASREFDGGSNKWVKPEREITPFTSWLYYVRS